MQSTFSRHLHLACVGRLLGIYRRMQLLKSSRFYMQHLRNAGTYMYRNGFVQTCNSREVCRVQIGVLASAFRVLKYFRILRYFHVSKSHRFTQPPNEFISLVTSQSGAPVCLIASDRPVSPAEKWLAICGMRWSVHALRQNESSIFEMLST